MNPVTGEVVQLERNSEGKFIIPRGFVPVSPHVAEAQLEGQRVLATRKLQQMRKRKRERQNRRRGRRA